MLKSPGSNPTPGEQNIITFVKNLYFFKFFLKINFYHKKLPSFKHILALLTWGLIWIVSKIQLFQISIFQMKHPVNQEVSFEAHFL